MKSQISASSWGRYSKGNGSWSASTETSWRKSSWSRRTTPPSKDKTTEIHANFKYHTSKHISKILKANWTLCIIKIRRNLIRTMDSSKTETRNRSGSQNLEGLKDKRTKPINHRIRTESQSILKYSSSRPKHNIEATILPRELSRILQSSQTILRRRTWNQQSLPQSPSTSTKTRATGHMPRIFIGPTSTKRKTKWQIKQARRSTDQPRKEAKIKASYRGHKITIIFKKCQGWRHAGLLATIST